MNSTKRERPALVVVGAEGGAQVDARRARYDFSRCAQVRLRRGVYVPADDWREASSLERYLLRIDAVLRTRRTRPVLGYWSAAAVWGLPRVGPWPFDVHVVVPKNYGAHSKHGVRFHREPLGEGDVCEVDGILLTSAARTLIDIGRTESFTDAVVAMDAALDSRRLAEAGRVHGPQLSAALDSSRRGRARAARAAAFADGGAANPGETISRIAVFECGFPAPILQTEHRNPRGGRYFTDFEWPEHRLIGEFDGRGKYLKEEWLGGQSPGEVVYEEKVREDHLRAEGNKVVRWGWHELNEPGRLIALLSAAELPYRTGPSGGGARR